MNSNIFTNMASLDATFNTSLDHLSNAYSDHHLPTISFHDHPRSNIPMFDSMAHFFSSGLGSDAMSMASEPQMMLNSSPLVPGTCFIEPAVSKKHQEQGYGGKKRKRSNEKEMENQREVVHVRAKRGQATDSHSLAERLRREKINDKLRCLQDLVPGCYKTMGMAVMLDVIINYVRSLQNQIDFLSMKLSAASLFYDFNSSEAEAMETLQGSAAYEAGQMMEKLVDGYGENSQFQTPWPL